jgi:hypothetical protein
VTAISVDGRLPEHLLGLGLGADAHILLAKVLDMVVDAGTGKLLRERDLLQRELVDGCAHRAKQRCRGEDGSLHDCDEIKRRKAGAISVKEIEGRIEEGVVCTELEIDGTSNV